MRIKRIICLLLSIILVIGTMSVSQANQQNCIFEEIISDGIGSSEIYLREQLETLHNNGGVSYGFEWYIISMLRSGKDIDSDILEKYYTSVCDTARNWDSNTKPTDAARVALALTLMGKSVTDVNGINLLDIIFNNEKLDDGSNELAYALISVYASGEDISDKFKWDINSVINELLKFQATDGGFGLYDNTTSDIDMTAICLQALSLFKGTELVDNAISKAVGFLGNVTSEPRNYSDNPNTTAQILIAVSMLNIDVSDFSNGFGIDEQNNIITALEKYRNPEGSGYIYGSDVNSMTTTQVMQAYDAHRKAHKEGVAYWDFGTEGQKYDDNSTDDEPEKPEENEATPADVFVTISDSGKIVSGKDGSYIAQARITVTDLNKDGSLSVDEALFATHEAYFEGGAKEGYASHITAYGLSLARLWGKGSIESPSVSGYYLNNTGCFSLADEVKDGDCLTAFNYFDTTGWSDSYAYFIENSVESPKGESVTLTLNALGYDSSWNVVASPYSGAKVSFLGSDETLGTTDENGTVTLNTTDMDAGTYYITAYSETNSIVPAVCKISITSSADEPGGSTGGGSHNKITVYIRVADPKGSTYLKKTAYSVKKGTTAYELLQETKLNIVASQSTYGFYVNKIENLAEFDEGPESGWIYLVNKKSPSQSSDVYSLNNGDYVEWLYTRNMGKDIDDSNYSGASISGGSATKDKTEEPETIPETKDDAKFTADTFNDVNEDDWFFNSVKYVYENSLMSGMGSGFEPQTKMTRAMLVTVLWRIEKEPDSGYITAFDDVSPGKWYAKAVCWAESENIVSGIGNNLFGTDDEITREQMVTILYRYVQKKNIQLNASQNTTINNFEDRESISEYANSAMEWAVNCGLIQGKSETTIAPKDSATRAEVATVLMRFCEGF